MNEIRSTFADRFDAIQTDSAPQPAGPYSQAVVVAPFVYLSGQRPVHPETGEIPEGTTAQAHQVFHNMRAVLAAANCSLTDVVKVTVHLASISDFDVFNEVYRDYFSAPYPVRTTVGSELRGILVEVDVMAIAPASK